MTFLSTYAYHVPMIRFAFYIARQQLIELRRLAKFTGLAVSEHLRRAIDGYLKAHKEGREVKSVRSPADEASPRPHRPDAGEIFGERT